MKLRSCLGQNYARFVTLCKSDETCAAAKRDFDHATSLLASPELSDREKLIWHEIQSEVLLEIQRILSERNKSNSTGDG